MYNMAFITYLVAAGHFGTEWLVFGTARWGPGLAGPIIVSGMSIVWMWMQWSHYIK